MNKNNSGARFAVFLAIGIAIGAALDNIALGMIVGGVLGMAFGSIKTKEDDDKKGDNNESK